MVDLGMSPSAALLTSSQGSAKLLGVDKETGTLEAGKFADMVLIDGNPLIDINDVLNVAVTIKGGRIVSDTRKK